MFKGFKGHRAMSMKIYKFNLIVQLIAVFLMFLDISELQSTPRMASKCCAMQCSKAILNNHPVPVRKEQERELLLHVGATFSDSFSSLCQTLAQKLRFCFKQKSCTAFFTYFHIFPELIPAPCPLLQSLRQSLLDSAGPGAQ